MFMNYVSNSKTFILQYYCRRYINNNIASISKIHREIYTRMYPTKVVLENGASINIRYHEPRKIIKVSNNTVQLFHKWITEINLFLTIIVINVSDT